MAITNKLLADKLKFTLIKGEKNMIRPVGDDVMLVASKGHIYLNGAHLINTEFIDIDFLSLYIEKVIHAKKKANSHVGD